MGGQLDDEAFGQWLDAVIFVLVFGLDRLAADRDDRALHGRRADFAGVRVDLFVPRIAIHDLDRPLIFGADVAAIDGKRTVGIDADEHAGDGDLVRVVADRTIVEGFDGRFDLTQSGIDFVRKLIRVLILGNQAVELVLQRIARRLLLRGDVDRNAFDLAETMRDAVGNADGGFDPLPAVARDLVGDRRQLFGDEAIEKTDVLEPAAIVGLEQVAQNRAARCLIGADADEDGALVRGADRGLGQHAPNLKRLFLPAIAEGLPDLLLTSMVMRHAEGHELFECHAVFGIDIEQSRRDRHEAQALLHDVDADEEGGGDGLLGHALVAHGLEGAELVERMKRCALDVLGERNLVDEDAGVRGRYDAGDRGGLVEPLLLGEHFQRAVAAAAGGHLEHAGLLAIAIENGPHMEALDQAATGD